MNYDKLVEEREVEICDKPYRFVWIKGETGAWNGPRNEWPEIKWYIEKYCKRDDIAIQAGGNQGMYPLLMSEMFRLVYTFEPDPLNFYCLTRNCQVDNVLKFNSALGAFPTTAVLEKHAMYNTGMHKVKIDQAGGQTPLLPIDGFDFPSHVGLIQLDVEGFELEVIRGAIYTIAEHKPLLILENCTPLIEQEIKPHGYRQVGQTKAADTVWLVV